MNRFEWRLDRLLEIRQKQRRALEAHVAQLSEQVAALKGQIAMQKAMMRSAWSNLRQIRGVERICQQALFMEYIGALDRRIEELRNQAQAVQAQRQEKIKQLTQLHKQVKSLEQLRQKAWQEYVEQARKTEQKLLDEKANHQYSKNRAQTAISAQ